MSSAGDEPAVDESALSTLMESIGGERELLEDLASEYLADLDGLIAEMEASIADGDTERFGRAAHSMKSTSASFGAMRLSEVGRELEEDAISGTLPEGIPAVHMEADKVRSDLPDVIAGLEARG